VLGDEVMTATIGPFRSEKLRDELEQHDGGVDLRRVLETVVDRFEAIERDGAGWVELQKRVERVATA
jgi:hypothetical protein